MSNQSEQCLPADPSQIEADTSLILKQEKHILLVLNELCRQISCPSMKEDDLEIDLLSVAQKLQESGMSVKQT